MIQVEITDSAIRWMKAIFDDATNHAERYKQEIAEAESLGQPRPEADGVLLALEPWALAAGQHYYGEMPDVKWIKSLANKTRFKATEAAVVFMIGELKYWEGYCADLSWAGDATSLEASAWSRSCESNHQKMQAALDQYRDQ
jgi:hypothetical protein